MLRCGGREGERMKKHYNLRRILASAHTDTDKLFLFEKRKNLMHRCRGISQLLLLLQILLKVVAVVGVKEGRKEEDLDGDGSAPSSTQSPAAAEAAAGPPRPPRRRPRRDPRPRPHPRRRPHQRPLPRLAPPLAVHPHPHLPRPLPRLRRRRPPPPLLPPQPLLPRRRLPRPLPPLARRSLPPPPLRPPLPPPRLPPHHLPSPRPLLRLLLLPRTRQPLPRRMLPPPSFRDFPALKRLVLQDVTLPDELCLSGLVSRCPSLVELVLVRVNPPTIGLRIACPKLRHFRFQGDFNGVSFTGGQVLDRVSIFLEYDDEMDVGLAEMFCGHAVCRGKLKLHSFTVEALAKLNIPNSIPYSFRMLVVLKMRIDWVERRHIMLLFCLLRSAPNLEELYLQGSSTSFVYDRNMPAPGDDFWEQESVDRLGNLRILEMDDTVFSISEMRFMHLVLTKAPVLEKLATISASKLDWNEYLYELWNYRASTQLQIAYINKQEEEDEEVEEENEDEDEEDEDEDEEVEVDEDEDEEDEEVEVEEEEVDEDEDEEDEEVEEDVEDEEDEEEEEVGDEDKDEEDEVGQKEEVEEEEN